MLPVKSRDQHLESTQCTSRVIPAPAGAWTLPRKSMSEAASADQVYAHFMI